MAILIAQDSIGQFTVTRNVEAHNLGYCLLGLSFVAILTLAFLGSKQK